jgi:hypothetical protein
MLGLGMTKRLMPTYMLRVLPLVQIGCLEKTGKLDGLAYPCNKVRLVETGGFPR